MLEKKRSNLYRLRINKISLFLSAKSGSSKKNVRPANKKQKLTAEQVKHKEEIAKIYGAVNAARKLLPESKNFRRYYVAKVIKQR